MKTLVLDASHRALGAKMVDFAGYSMPIQYRGLKQEHQQVREAVGIFDVSHMGEFWISGPGALAFLQKVTSNDVAKLSAGKIQYSCFPNDRGGIVDDLLVYCLGEEEYMLVVNASNIDKDWAWLQQHCPAQGVQMSNRSEDYCLFAVQGPRAVQALAGLSNMDLAGMAYYTFERGSFAGVEDMIVSATGYTGAGGFELYVPSASAQKLWDAIMDSGAPEGIEPIGLGARDTLRMEKGFCLYGNDIDDSTSPLEAGLGWITKFNKDFINSEALAAQKEAGVECRLKGFVLTGRGIPRQGYALMNAAGERIGRVTSGTQSPSLDKAIGMGYLDKGYWAEGTEIFVEIRQKLIPAVVTKIPFL